MATQRRIDPKARAAAVVAGVMVLLVPIFMIGKVALGRMEAGSVQQPFAPGSAELVQMPDGTTMLVKHGSARRIADWLHLDREGKETFEVGNANFEPKSAKFTHDGWEHVVQFSQMLKGHPGVSATILFSAYHGNQGTEMLEHLRADRIHDEAVRQGVSEDQIAVSKESFEAGHNAAADEGLEVVLTNRK